MASLTTDSLTSDSSFPASMVPQSALAEFAAEGNGAVFENAGVQLREQTSFGLVRLQCRAPDAHFYDLVDNNLLPMAAVGEVTQKELTDGFYRCAGLGPEEWLLIGPEFCAAKSIACFQTCSSTDLALATDITDSYVAILVTGSAVRKLLAKACALDLHPDRFLPEHCAQTLLAKLRVLIVCHPEDRYELYIDSSHANYLWRWLVDAAQEFAFIDRHQS